MKVAKSLQARFALVFSLLMVSLTVIISLTIGWLSSDNLREEIGSSFAETAYQMADKMDQYMWSRAGEITVLSQLDIVRRFDNMAQVGQLLDGLKKSFPSFSWVGLTDINGQVIAGTDGILVGAYASKRPAYIKGLEGPYIGDVHDAVMLSSLLPNPSGEPIKFVDISTPVFGYSGEKLGVLSSHLSWAWVSEIRESIMEPLKSRKQLDIFVLSYNDGTVLLGPKEMIGQKLPLKSTALAKQGTNSWIVETWPDGKEYLTGYAFGKGYADYKGVGWSVLVRQPVDIAFASIRKLQILIWIIGGVFSVIFGLVGWFMASAISKPLGDLTKAADRLRFGGIVTMPAHKGIAEIEILAATLQDLTESLSDTRNALGKMEEVACSDRLTHLPNRTGLDNFLDVAIPTAKRRNLEIIFLYLDLDGFKAINDTMGHHAGDLLLKEVAVRLKVLVQEEEIAARLGGDEFLMVLYSKPMQSYEAANTIGQRIIRTLNVPYIIEGKTVSVGCSVGGAIWPHAGLDVKEVINLADEALYKAKKTGKNKFVLTNSQVTGIAMS